MNSKMLRRSFQCFICGHILLGFVPSVTAQLRLLSESEIVARLPLLREVDFENLDADRARGVFRSGGIIFTNTRVSECAATQCTPDPDNARGANMVIHLNPRREPIMFFLEPSRFVVLEVLDDGEGPFTLEVRDARQQRYIVQGQRPGSGSAFLGMEVLYGVRKIEVGDDSGPVGVATVFLHDVPPPTKLVARPVWSTQVNLTWKYSPSGQTSFDVERSVGSRSNFVALATVPPDTTAFEDLNVSPGTRYFYRVRADHPNGESAYSNEASARTGGQERRVILRSIGGEDGTVCENFEFSDRGEAVFGDGSGGDALLVGDLRGDQQCKAILSFDTSSIPDNARIVSAVLRLRQGTRAGNASGALGPLYVDISEGEGFGTTATLTADDFEAPGAASRVATLRPGSDGSRTARLSRAGVARINTAGRTQFRLSFGTSDNDNMAADNVGFFSGEADRPGNRPVLEIIYRPRTATAD